MPAVQKLERETVLMGPPPLSWMRTWLLSIVIRCDGPATPMVSGGISVLLSPSAAKFVAIAGPFGCGRVGGGVTAAGAAGERRPRTAPISRPGEAGMNGTGWGADSAAC